eukprot:gnl/Chilomastix_cuspidata/3250.p1 GENE.gnl/Chilomastix_cuspidata/3250~~gnl/Chilomastix_cuspidata/3250.p1  ORF type:complete len:1975 (-),score=120.14 gnl/Chilomastix_cuspidata/3250:248-6172(-)
MYTHDELRKQYSLNFSDLIREWNLQFVPSQKTRGLFRHFFYQNNLVLLIICGFLTSVVLIIQNNQEWIKLRLFHFSTSFIMYIVLGALLIVVPSLLLLRLIGVRLNYPNQTINSPNKLTRRYAFKYFFQQICGKCNTSSSEEEPFGRLFFGSVFGTYFFAFLGLAYALCQLAQPSSQTANIWAYLLLFTYFFLLCSMRSKILLMLLPIIVSVLTNFVFFRTDQDLKRIGLSSFHRKVFPNPSLACLVNLDPNESSFAPSYRGIKVTESLISIVGILGFFFLGISHTHYYRNLWSLNVVFMIFTIDVQSVLLRMMPSNWLSIWIHRIQASQENDEFAHSRTASPIENSEIDSLSKPSTQPELLAFPLHSQPNSLYTPQSLSQTYDEFGVVNFLNVSIPDSLASDRFNQLWVASLDYISSELNVRKLKTVGTNYMTVFFLPDELKSIVFSKISMYNPKRSESATYFHFSKEEQELLLRESPEVYKKLEIGLSRLCIFNLVAIRILSYLTHIISVPSEKQLLIHSGAHIGKVSGGVIGTDKLIYDIFGTTVNAAARLTSASKPSSMYISNSFLDIISRYTSHFIIAKYLGFKPYKGLSKPLETVKVVSLAQHKEKMKDSTEHFRITSFPDTTNDRHSSSCHSHTKSHSVDGLQKDIHHFITSDEFKILLEDGVLTQRALVNLVIPCLLSSQPVIPQYVVEMLRTVVVLLNSSTILDRSISVSSYFGINCTSSISYFFSKRKKIFNDNENTEEQTLQGPPILQAPSSSSIESLLLTNERKKKDSLVHNQPVLGQTLSPPPQMISHSTSEVDFSTQIQSFSSPKLDLFMRFAKPFLTNQSFSPKSSLSHTGLFTPKSLSHLADHSQAERSLGFASTLPLESIQEESKDTQQLIGNDQKPILLVKKLEKVNYPEYEEFYQRPPFEVTSSHSTISLKKSNAINFPITGLSSLASPEKSSVMSFYTDLFSCSISSSVSPSLSPMLSRRNSNTVTELPDPSFNIFPERATNQFSFLSTSNSISANSVASNLLVHNIVNDLPHIYPPEEKDKHTSNRKSQNQPTEKSPASVNTKSDIFSDSVDTPNCPDEIDPSIVKRFEIIFYILKIFNIPFFPTQLLGDSYFFFLNLSESLGRTKMFYTICSFVTIFLSLIPPVCCQIFFGFSNHTTWFFTTIALILLFVKFIVTLQLLDFQKYTLWNILSQHSSISDVIKFIPKRSSFFLIWTLVLPFLKTLIIALTVCSFNELDATLQFIHMHQHASSSVSDSIDTFSRVVQSSLLFMIGIEFSFKNSFSHCFFPSVVVLLIFFIISVFCFQIVTFGLFTAILLMQLVSIYLGSLYVKLMFSFHLLKVFCFETCSLLIRLVPPSLFNAVFLTYFRYVINIFSRKERPRNISNIFFSTQSGKTHHENFPFFKDQSNFTHCSSEQQDSQSVSLHTLPSITEPHNLSLSASVSFYSSHSRPKSHVFFTERRAVDRFQSVSDYIFSGIFSSPMASKSLQPKTSAETSDFPPKPVVTSRRISNDTPDSSRSCLPNVNNKRLWHVTPLGTTYTRRKTIAVLGNEQENPFLKTEHHKTHLRRESQCVPTMQPTRPTQPVPPCSLSLSPKKHFDVVTNPKKRPDEHDYKKKTLSSNYFPSSPDLLGKISLEARKQQQKITNDLADGVFSAPLDKYQKKLGETFNSQDTTKYTLKNLQEMKTIPPFLKAYTIDKGLGSSQAFMKNRESKVLSNILSSHPPQFGGKVDLDGSVQCLSPTEVEIPLLFSSSSPFDYISLSLMSCFHFAENVTVLHSDIVGFTEFCSTRDSRNVINILRVLFDKYDRAAKMHGVEKIRTIGDAFEAVSGLTSTVSNSVTRVTALAFDILRCTAEVSKLFSIELEIRVGIATGHVTGQVVGINLPAYDIFGETVNRAEHLESQALQGTVLVDSVTAQDLFLNPAYVLEPHLFCKCHKGILRTSEKTEPPCMVASNAHEDRLRRYQNFIVKEKK